MKNKNLKTKAGYEYLLAYKITVPIYDYTVEFVKRWINGRSRTKDQMEQAARSGMTNIAEGNKQKSLELYIKLAGISRGSLEELLKDYLSFARQNSIDIWDKQRCVREIREIGQIWEIIKKNPTLPDSPNFPNLPHDKEKAVNLMLTLINQANYLLDKLVEALLKKHQEKGGFSENLLKRRIEYRSIKLKQ
ncbi:MAG: hypothetical protein A2958_01840 [Candidatus Levybacteria bacterium RIFCSPLOWO2_01_FULL_38_13]|nr:MAG: hypothetical protein A2629_02595 [Candidatus Levybacteria bacterium RIFCSPHIGHO2_01_FULL_41_15]OGH35749.1 MAG: hypothetical protein A2958_01840 [Candidatus Levybacteria bacterium RIFCSPLOWO2_01_FULL_38_13]